MDLIAAIESGASNPIVLIGAALLLGAMHGLEPGHSKTMMAAFIIAVRGTVWQAVLLGLSAAISHSFVVWILALLALRYGEDLIGEDLEPWLLLGSGLLIVLIGLWIFIQTRRAQKRQAQAHHHSHSHSHSHSHAHRHPHPAVQNEDALLDAHARAHAREVEARFTSGKATALQTVLFGLSGGLIPCTAAITVLIGLFMLGSGAAHLSAH